MRAGDLVQEPDGSWQAVTASVREAHPAGITVYNFEVGQDHTYFVADADNSFSDPVWVHNQYTPCGAMAGRRVGHTFTRHGEGEEVANFLRHRAKGSGQSQGQWTNNLQAETYIAESLKHLGNGTAVLPLPPGLGRVHHPDGTITEALFAKLVPSGSGVKTAFPVSE